MLLVERRKNDLTLHNLDNVDLFNLLGILLDGSRPAGEIRGRVIGYTRGRRVEGRIEGRTEEIIETGHEFGLSDEDILGRLQRKLDVSLEMAGYGIRVNLEKTGREG